MNRMQSTFDKKFIPVTAHDCLKMSCDDCMYIKAGGNKNECPQLWKNNDSDTDTDEKHQRNLKVKIYKRYIFVKSHVRIVGRRKIEVRAHLRRNRRKKIRW